MLAARFGQIARRERDLAELVPRLRLARLQSRLARQLDRILLVRAGGANLTLLKQDNPQLDITHHLSALVAIAQAPRRVEFFM